MSESGNQNYWQQPSSDQQASTPPQPPVAPIDPSPPTEPVQPSFATESVPVDAHEAEVPPPPHTPSINITWQAAEFIDHHKGIGWFAAFGLFAVIVISIGVFLLKDWFVTIGFVIMIIAVAAMALRPARTLQYAIDDDGVHVGDKLYAYQEFQSFSLQHDETSWSVFLMPSARFKPALTIYFTQEQGEEIVDALGHFLPMEEHKLDMIDRFAAKIRF